jgi:hypothetical protein
MLYGLINLISFLSSLIDKRQYHPHNVGSLPPDGFPPSNSATEWMTNIEVCSSYSIGRLVFVPGDLTVTAMHISELGLAAALTFLNARPRQRFTHLPVGPSNCSVPHPRT